MPCIDIGYGNIVIKKIYTLNDSCRHENLITFFLSVSYQAICEISSENDFNETI